MYIVWSCGQLGFHLGRGLRGKGLRRYHLRLDIWRHKKGTMCLTDFDKIIVKIVSKMYSGSRTDGRAMV